MLLKDRDVVGQAQTGTGKTAAFMLPILERIDPEMRDVQALVLCPTRELALQVADAPAARPHLDGVEVRAGLRRRADPRADRPARARRPGRRRHAGPRARPARRGKLILDRRPHGRARRGRRDALDGLHRRRRAILRRAPWGRQTALFSATMPPEIRKLAAEELHSPETVSVTPEDDHRRAHRAALCSRSSRAASSTPSTACSSPRRRAARSSSPAPRSAASELAERPAGARLPRPRDARRHEPGRARLGHDRASAAARWRSSWPPTSPRAASTSRRSATSSTTTCPTSPRCTSTASAAPAGSAVTARPSRWSPSASSRSSTRS